MDLITDILFFCTLIIFVGFMALIIDIIESFINDLSNALFLVQAFSLFLFNDNTKWSIDYQKIITYLLVIDVVRKIGPIKKLQVHSLTPQYPCTFISQYSILC